MFTECGILCGARASAILGVKAKDINFADNSIIVYEPKRKKYLVKFPPLCLFKILKRYIQDHNLQLEDKIFPKGYDFYNNTLKKAGKKAGLTKIVTTHILKHTFVSQGHRHGLSRETVVEQTGTEDRTIKLYYLSVEENKIRQETQGLEFNENAFFEWAENLHLYFEQKYEDLNGAL